MGRFACHVKNSGLKGLWIGVDNFLHFLEKLFPGRRNHRMKILIVDDDTPVITALTRPFGGW